MDEWELESVPRGFRSPKLHCGLQDNIQREREKPAAFRREKFFRQFQKVFHPFGSSLGWLDHQHYFWVKPLENLQLPSDYPNLMALDMIFPQ